MVVDNLSKKDMIILQPEYVEGFQCDGSKCDAKCCKTHWRISIDKNTYKKYQRIKKPETRKRIITSLEPDTEINGCMQIKFNAEGACPLLCSDKLCYIQRNLGEDALSLTCQVYPRVVRHVGNCQLRILSMACPVAAEAALFSEHGMDIKKLLPFQESNAWKLALLTKKYIKLDEKDTFMAVNVILGGLSILQNTAYTREQRLVILGLFLDKADDLKNTPSGAEDIAGLAMFYNGEEFKGQMEDLFADWTFYPTAHRQLLAGILSTMQGKEFIDIAHLLRNVRDYENNYKKFHELIENDYGKAMDNYWQQEFLFHGFPFRIEGSFLHNYFAYLLAYNIWELYIYGVYQAGKGSVTKDVLLGLISIYSRSLEHRMQFVSSMVEHTAPFEEEPIKLMQVLLRLN